MASSKSLHPAPPDAAAPIRVLHVTQATGGVETSLLLLFQHLDRHRLDLTLACPPGTALPERAAALGVRVVLLPMVREVRPLADLLGLWRLWRLMRRERYDVVHSHSAKAGVLGRLAAWLAGTPVSLYSPRAFSYLSQRGVRRRIFRWIERAMRPLTSTLVAASRSEQRRAVDDVGFDPARVTVIVNSIDPAEAGTGDSAAIDHTTPTILTVGRLGYQKNPAMFVRVAALVAARVPTSRFTVLGAGFASPEEPAVRRMVRQAGLESRVEILPWSSKAEVLERIRTCAVFVLTSRFEGMPNVVLEAMMLGRAPVVTDVDGSRDVVHDGVTGFVVPLDDDTAMAAGVERLLSDPALASRMGAAARQTVLRDHDIRRNAAALATLYGLMLTNR